jgi:hypothetical protein
MDIKISVEDSIIDNIDNIKLKQMVFLFNALDDGWTIKKNKDCYYFTKKHEGKKEVFSSSYLSDFMKTNFNVNSVNKL